jgi:hypothetical protein
MTERRYSEEEVAAIFERAADPQRTRLRELPQGEGMTLASLQGIGREVGISPELVAQAASSLDQAGRLTSRTFLGLPIGVGRVVELDYPHSDEGWESLVVDLRQTFDARGTVRLDGPFRQWTNGNLQALVEPTEAGHRVRLQTINGNSRGLMIGGLALLGIAAVTLVAATVAGGLGDTGSLRDVGFISAIGLGMFGYGALRLPSWARRRRIQMAAVAERLTLGAKSQLARGADIT